ncbi:hypothetical protein BY996DRAFT_6508158 [Phakopsora pachyrhizi]|nr:hypothetical protein BY996DRAFT_6508158 [Phakopsora pachyrhizi]
MPSGRPKSETKWAVGIGAELLYITYNTCFSGRSRINSNTPPCYDFIQLSLLDLAAEDSCYHVRIQKINCALQESNLGPQLSRLKLLQTELTELLYITYNTCFSGRSRINSNTPPCYEHKDTISSFIQLSLLDLASRINSNTPPCYDFIQLSLLDLAAEDSCYHVRIQKINCALQESNLEPQLSILELLQTELTEILYITYNTCFSGRHNQLQHSPCYDFIQLSLLDLAAEDSCYHVRIQKINCALQESNLGPQLSRLKLLQTELTELLYITYNTCFSGRSRINSNTPPCYEHKDTISSFIQLSLLDLADSCYHVRIQKINCSLQELNLGPQLSRLKLLQTELTELLYITYNTCFSGRSRINSNTPPCYDFIQLSLLDLAAEDSCYHVRIQKINCALQESNLEPQLSILELLQTELTEILYITYNTCFSGRHNQLQHSPCYDFIQLSLLDLAAEDSCYHVRIQKINCALQESNLGPQLSRLKLLQTELTELLYITYNTCFSGRSRINSNTPPCYDFIQLSLLDLAAEDSCYHVRIQKINCALQESNLGPQLSRLKLLQTELTELLYITYNTCFSGRSSGNASDIGGDCPWPATSVAKAARQPPILLASPDNCKQVFFFF